jgi:predicted TIM-barrel fold metal-dependent hydrolase
MDIVDAQVHVGLGGIDTLLAQMDAIGINAVLIDEFWGRHPPDHPLGFEPGYLLPNGVWRCTSPIAELASTLHPNRFSYFLRVDRQDPDLESIVTLLKASPHGRALRILPTFSEAEVKAFSEGGYDHLFDLAQSFELPVFAFVPGSVELLAPYLKRFPRLSVVIDHTGMPWGPPSLSYLDKILETAAYPNVALKWSHAQRLFGVDEYPYAALTPLLRRTVSAFGAERVIWASDKTVNPAHTWADMLFCIRDNPAFTTTEKEWILGRSLRTIISWPASAQQ